ncbi:PREDICTED: uncharacterized protein LOC106744172 [Dinoponera quadriceps]|uniref:Uncharacterized protein LOC106744172 n=1 Tax=Dinoponera quadriceps TaxID=609295 RepID=A0A6P3X8F6_DINQU|nr:PREDICTED: uncharacterized protein LOC106744172 [Dinoponera quadriceps]
MFKIEGELLRYDGPLTPDRYNKFFNPNLCHVCKEKDTGNLITCDQYYTISYCSMEHKMLHHPEHEQICRTVKKNLEKDPQWRIRKLNPNEWFQSRKLSLNLDIGYLNSYSIKLKFRVFPGPRSYLPAWELILHLLHQMKELIIILIGPGLQNERGNIDACLTCKVTYGQRLFLETHGMPYHDYVNSQLYKRPNVIIAFQAELYREHIGEGFLRAVRHQNCPLLITATSVDKLKENMNTVNQLLSTWLFSSSSQNRRFVCEHSTSNSESIQKLYFLVSRTKTPAQNIPRKFYVYCTYLS